MPYSVWPSAATRSKPTSGGAIVQPGCGVLIASGRLGAIAVSGQAPSLGAHKSRADVNGAGGNPDPAPVTLTGSLSGSTRIVFVGGSFSETSPPTDSLGSTVTQLGTDLADLTKYPMSAVV